jgi:hypothetical protein
MIDNPPPHVWVSRIIHDAIRVKDMSTYIGSTPRDNRIEYLKGFQKDASTRRRV